MNGTRRFFEKMTHDGIEILKIWWIEHATTDKKWRYSLCSKVSSCFHCVPIEVNGVNWLFGRKSFCESIFSNEIVLNCNKRSKTYPHRESIQFQCYLQKFQKIEQKLKYTHQINLLMDSRPDSIKYIAHMVSLS